MAITMSAWASDCDIEPAKGIPLFLKIITYDESFDAKKIDQIMIYILYDASRPKSYEQYLKAEEFFRKNQDIAVSGVEIKNQPIIYGQIDSAFKASSNSVYKVILVTDIGEDKIKEIINKTQSSKVRSFSLCPEYVPLGLAISVDPERKSKAIVVNLNSSKLEGSKFSAHLLKMCEIL